MTQQPTATFGSLLRMYRRLAGLSQEELAERADISRRTVSDLERGVKVTPQAATLSLIASALQLADEDRVALTAAVPRRRHGSPQPEASFEDCGAVPVEMTLLVGREHDEAALVHLIMKPGVRMLTLVGPGGVGKTRLAQRAAATLFDSFPDGVSFVSLASTTKPEDVIGVIARAVGLRTKGGAAARELSDWLGSRTVLLVLDNFEHLLPAARDLGNLLSNAGGLSLLVTSRAPLRLRAEHLYDVRPLSYPDSPKGLTVEEALGHPAVALFVVRAQAVSPGYVVTPADVAAVVEICRRLDESGDRGYGTVEPPKCRAPAIP